MFLFVNFCTYMAGCALGLFAHEAGHWCIGRLLGFTILDVSVGTGPVWYRGRLGTTPVELRPYPTRGEVRYLLHPPKGRLASILFFLGGIAGNVVVLVLFALATAGPSTPTLDLFAPGLVLAQITMIGLNLVPHRGGRYGSDGYRIVHILFHRRSAKAQTFAAMARPYRMADDPAPMAPSPYLLRYCGRFDAGKDRPTAARNLLRELDRGKARPDEALLVLDKLITRQLLQGDVGLAGRLDEISKRALDLAPAIATLRRSRGASLVELGRYAEGKALLAPLVDGELSFDTILTRLFLARAELGLGDEAEARRLVEAARVALVANPVPDAQILLERVEAEIAATAARPSALEQWPVSPAPFPGRR